MKIRVLKEFGGYRKGQVFDWGDGFARVMVARGMIEEVTERPVETAAVEERAERAVAQPVARRKKG